MSTSNDHNGFAGVDNLTPFEYALAGVVPADAHESPSLAVIDEMRRLAADVADAPVNQPRLREFLETGGAIARRNDRRSSTWRRRATTSGPDTAAGTNGNGNGHSSSTPTPIPTPPGEQGGFVDITPIELTEHTPVPEPTEEHPAIATPEPEAPATTAAGATATAADLPPTAEDGTGPVEDDIDDREIERIQAALRGVLAPPAGPADQPDIGDPEPDVEGLRPAPAEPTPEPAATAPHPPARPDGARPIEPVRAEATPPTAPTDDDRTRPLGVATAAAQTGDGETGEGATEQAATGEAATTDPPSLFPDVPDIPDIPDADDSDAADDRNQAGRLAPVMSAVPASEPLLTGPSEADDDADGAVLVPAAAGVGATILHPEPPSDVAPMASLSTVDPSTPMVNGRFGNPVVALVGTAAAAAILAIGGLWWAAGLSDGEPDTAALGDLETGTGQEVVAGGPSADGDGDDGRSAEFGPDGSTRTTERATVTVSTPERATSTMGTTTAAESSAAPSSGSATTGSTATETTGSPTVERPAGTKPPSESTAPEVTVATTAEPATTRAPALSPVTITGSVRAGSKRVRDVSVRLLSDIDSDRSGDQVIDTRTTGGNGRFSFEAPAGCFELQFTVPSGYTMSDGQNSRYVCLEPGKAATVDALADEVRADPPSGCRVEWPGRESWMGVEVFENGANWADSYTFYDQSGSVVVRTRDMGPADDIEGSTNREWHAVANGFDHRRVYSVAAERNGVESAPVGCQREQGDPDD